MNKYIFLNTAADCEQATGEILEQEFAIFDSKVKQLCTSSV